MSELGTSLAAYTRYQVIHAAAWMEFSAHLQELVAEGREREALRLWASVVELVHLGSPGQPLSIAGFPPVRRFVCTNIPCARCADRRGGFQFPWVGVWNRCCLLVQEGLGPAVAWQRYHASAARLDRLALQWIAFDLGPLDILNWPWSGWTTGTMASTPRSSSSWFGFGSRGGGHGGNHGHPWLGPQAFPAKSRMPAEPSARSWGPWPMTLSTFPPSASFVASPRSSPVESVDRSFVKAATSGQGSARCASTVLAQTSAIVLAGLMADRGRYAVESAGSSRWDPETSSEVAQAARVREFREQYHLLDDADFAFAFRSAEEALLAGGRGLADAWTKARSEQTEELVPLAASTVEAGSSRDRPAHALHLPAPPVPVRKGVTLSQQAFSADSVNRRVEALAKVFEDAGIHRPSVGNLSDAILAEWKLQLTRLAQVKVTKSEPQTVVNAVRTWSELVSFMRSRDRATIEHLDLASFLASGSKGPKRALNSLRWLNKLGHLGWQLDSIALDPPASRRAAARSQALVVEPPMLTHLERGIKEAFTRQDPRWTAMLGSWLVGAGYIATARSQLHIQGYEDTPLCSHRQSGQKSKGRLAQPSKCTSKMEAIAWGRPTCQVRGSCEGGVAPRQVGHRCRES